LPQQILWNKFHIRCAYFTPNCTWSLNYSVFVFLIAGTVVYRPMLPICQILPKNLGLGSRSGQRKV
jgi:hypothetical protein